jgi:hypothetical protein
LHPPVRFAGESFFVCRVRSDILCPLRRKPPCAKNLITTHGQKSRFSVWFNFEARNAGDVFHTNFNGWKCLRLETLCRKKRRGSSKHWRYDATELLLHASMPVFGGLVSTLTRTDLHHQPPSREVFSSEPQPMYY